MRHPVLEVGVGVAAEAHVGARLDDGAGLGEEQDICAVPPTDTRKAADRSSQKSTCQWSFPMPVSPMLWQARVRSCCTARTKVQLLQSRMKTLSRTQTIITHGKVDRSVAQASDGDWTA